MTVTKARSGKLVAGINEPQDLSETGNRIDECETMHVELDQQALRLCYRGRQSQIRSSLGAQYLYELLLHPGEKIDADELFHRYHDHSDGQNYLYTADFGALSREGLNCASFLPIPMTDLQALREIHLRLQQVRAQLSAKAQCCDASGLDELYQEAEQLECYLREVLSPNGKIRNFRGEQRKLKESVFRALKRAIDRIKSRDAELGDYLQRTVHCWDRLEYAPEIYE